MSLYGYKPKMEKANWTTVAGAQPVRASVKAAHDDRQRGVLGSRRFAFKARKPLKPRKRIAPVSKRRQAVNADYRRKARAFVAAARKRGETCPVVAAVPELRDGFRYGWPVSAELNEVHHKRGRAGALLTDERHWVALSKQGHRWVHEHPDEARARGWLCESGQWNEPDRSAP